MNKLFDRHTVTIIVDYSIFTSLPHNGLYFNPSLSQEIMNYEMMQVFVIIF